MNNYTSRKLQLIFVLAVSMLVTTASIFISTVNAKANTDHANEVAPNANTNGGYMKDCKQRDSAKNCATGPGNNGEFTSGAAHEINKP